MEFPKAQPTPAVTTAMVCAAAVGAQFVAGKATRDALFLANLDVTALPAMVVATAVFSILLVALSSRGLRRVAPGTLVPAAFARERRAPARRLGAVDGGAEAGRAGPLSAGVGSRPDARVRILADRHRTLRSAYRAAHVRPHRRRRHAQRPRWRACRRPRRRDVRRDGDVAGAGGAQPRLRLAEPRARPRDGRLAATSAAREDDAAMQAGSMLDARPTSRRRRPAPACGRSRRRRTCAISPRSCCSARWARRSSTTCSRCRRWKRSDAARASSASLPSTTRQPPCCRCSCRRLPARPPSAKLGLGLTTSTPPLALCVGGLGALAMPGLWSVVAMRGGESVFRGSLFRTGYEIFYTPVPPNEKRAAKSHHRRRIRSAGGCARRRLDPPCHPAADGEPVQRHAGARRSPAAGWR